MAVHPTRRCETRARSKAGESVADARSAPSTDPAVSPLGLSERWATIRCGGGGDGGARGSYHPSLCCSRRPTPPPGNTRGRARTQVVYLQRPGAVDEGCSRRNLGKCEHDMLLSGAQTMQVRYGADEVDFAEGAQEYSR
eukprot:ctg_351.g184